jgi:hypothetical protein
MKEIFFKVSLLSDLVINSKLATEGNMTSLDYIPGSNFLGITAGKLYSKLTKDENYTIFHSGKVRFGNAYITNNDLLAYPIPGMYFTDKLRKDLIKDPIFLDYLIDKDLPPTDNKGNRLQLKQVRGGYMLSDYTLFKSIEKSFAIKSAQDRTKRSSKEGAMFGFESIKKGLEFIFSVQFEDELYMSKISNALAGTHRIGKSKNAEFGQVKIEQLNQQPKTSDTFDNQFYTLVYAYSDLCFIDDFGMPTFQPTAIQLGLEQGEVDYFKSQIRTHTYSPWNFKRNTSSSQRNCITAGSVFYVKDAKKICDSKTIGLHQTEGLGKVIYNPAFLKGDENGLLLIKLKHVTDKKIPKEQSEQNTALTRFLAKKLKEQNDEKAISNAVQKLVYSDTSEIKSFKEISSSQWGGIRAYATKTVDYETLDKQLFDEKEGYLTHGIADEKYWGKYRGKNRKALKKILEQHKDLGTQFVAKFASEMAKECRKQNTK